MRAAVYSIADQQCTLTTRMPTQLARITLALTVLCLLALHAEADVSAGDAGELGGAAWTLGVAHPTGFPLDLLLLRAAALVPLGPLAFRQNLGVSLINACAVLCLVALCERVSARLGCVHGPSRMLGGALSAAALLASHTFLGSAVSVEVYGTAVLAVTAGAWLVEQADARRARALWPLLGCALGTHITAPLLLAPLLVTRALRDRWLRVDVFFKALCCGALGAVIIVYLPLAARRAGPFDWGDPSTLARLWRHLTAARIREAYAGQLFQVQDGPGVSLLGQLSEQPLLYLPALYACVVGLRRERSSVLLMLSVLALDLAYGSFINPMGIAARQVGHVSAAVLALAAGSGSALWLGRASQRRAWFVPTATIVAAASGALLWRAEQQLTAAEEHVIAERYGASSPLVDLAPRARYVCSSDHACAAGLFAIYAEGVRPDLAVAPAQHLWDPAVWLRLAMTDTRAVPTSAAARAALAEQRLGSLLASFEQRPLYVELGTRATDLSHAPFLAVSDTPSGDDAIAALVHARFGAAGPRTLLARDVWSRAYEAVGGVHLRARRGPAAIQAFERAAQLTPQRAVAHSNLGVALENAGELERALQETARAVELEPRREIAWRNLAGLLSKLYGPEAGEQLFHEAALRYGTTRK